MTCYDLRFPEHARALVDAGAEAIVIPAAWVAGDLKLDHWRTLLSARAIENTVYVVAAAQGGDRYTGHSLVVDPWGSIVGEADLAPEIIRATLEPEVVARAREVNPSLANRRIRTQLMSRAPKGGRRRLDASVPPEYDLPTREPRLDSPRAARFVMVLVFLGWVAGTAGSATSIAAVDTPASIERPSAALLMVVFAIGLTHRGGGHMRIWLPMTAALGVAAVTVETNVLLTSAAAVTAVLSSVWAVMVTRPVTTAIGAIREFALALLVALSGTIGVAAWNAPVDYQRFNLIVLTASLALAITLVWNLGAGLHGLGRQNLAILLGVAGLVMLVIAYSSFVRTHGSQSLVQGFSDTRDLDPPYVPRRPAAHRGVDRLPGAHRRRLAALQAARGLVDPGVRGASARRC